MSPTHHIVSHTGHVNLTVHVAFLVEDYEQYSVIQRILQDCCLEEVQGRIHQKRGRIM